jgi:hypothetical protein
VSQVIVETDELMGKRKQSALQEKRITTDYEFRRFNHKVSVTDRWLVERLLGYAVLPIVALWAFLFLVIVGVLYVSVGILKFIATPFGR